MSMRRNTGRDRRAQTQITAQTVDLSGAFFEWNAIATNVTKDGSNNVSQINDVSGNARHLTQGVAANDPLWVAASKGATPGIQFTTGGVNNKRVFKTGLAALFSGFEWTFACVTKCDTSPTAGVFHNLLQTTNSATGRGGLQMGWFGTAAFTRRLQMTRISDAAAGAVTFGNSSAGTWELWVVRLQGSADGSAATTVTTRVNGAAVANSGTIYTNIVDANGSIFLGTATATAVDFSGLWGKGWNRALNDASIASLEATINAAYSVY